MPLARGRPVKYSGKVYDLRFTLLRQRILMPLFWEMLDQSFAEDSKALVYCASNFLALTTHWIIMF